MWLVRHSPFAIRHSPFAVTMSEPPPLLIPALGKVYARLAPVTEALVRLIAGLSFVPHGYPKLFGDAEAMAEWFEEQGFEPGLLWNYLVGTVEIFGGLCLALGLATRVVAVPILGFLATAVVYHTQYGFLWNLKGFEYPLFWSVVVFHFLVRGGGPYSLDAALGREL
jgi:putative oxidoreductase